jgi:signal transduction histidine kinase
LSDAGENLARSFDHQEALSDVVRFAVPLLCDLCMLDAADGNGRLQRSAVWFADPLKQAELAEPLKAFAPGETWKTPEARAMASGKPIVVSDISSEMIDSLAHDGKHAALLARVGLRSLMAVPLVARDHTLGVLSFATAESERRFAAKDLAFAEDVAHRLAVAMDNARLYQQAQRAILARDNTMAVVSHDLRNPLGTIMMTAAQLMDALQEGGAAAESHAAVDTIRRAAHVMNRLIGDLLDIASLEAGGLAMDKRPTSGQALLREVSALMRPFAERAGVILTVHEGQGDALLSCDHQRIVQVLSNLIGNAVKFTDRSGTITLESTHDEHELSFSVTDTGHGISESELPHIFDRFWQASRTAHLGTGLGLSIAKAIAEAHGGRLRAESHPGTGSTFVLSLPRNGKALH